MEEYIITDKGKQNWVTAIVTLTVFMFSLDYSMLNISLPTIAGYFHVNLASVASLPTVYLLIVTSSLLAFGKLGDIKGYKTVFIAGLAVFSFGTILCAFSPNIKVLLGLRAFQSLGEAMVSPVGMAVITSFLPDNIKGRSLGILATAQGLGVALGSACGGLINAHFTWRAIFFVNIPIVILTIILAAKLLPSKQAEVKDKRFDIVGTVLIFFALASFVYAMNSVAGKGWLDPSISISFAVSIVAFILFGIQEKRSPYPLLDLKLFVNSGFAPANIAAFFVTFVLMGFIFLAPFYMEMVRGLAVSQAGLLLMAPSLTMMCLAPIFGKLSDRIGSSFLSCAGIAVSAAAFIILSIIDQHASIFYIILSLVLLGAGAGIFLAPNNKLVLANAPCDKQGVASGVYKIFFSTGSVFGIAIFPIVITSTVSLLAKKENITMAQVRYLPRVLQAGFHNAFIFGIFVCLAGLLFSFLAKDKKCED